MATDLERLVVQLSVDIKSYERALRAAGVVTGRQTKAMENQFNRTNSNIIKSFDRLGKSIQGALGRNLTAPLAGITGALAIQEIVRYADAWTLAGNKIAAAGAIAGREGRTLEGINEIARRTRGGLTETADLYAGLLRSTGRVAKSEGEVAQATETVIKAFKAGGAAASEQAAGILQLRQALGSGFLQGDELRSVRENAPVLAQAIADEFGVTIAGLKALGAEGKVTSDRVFKAILEGKDKIDRAFGTTQSTIGEAFKQVENALIQYIGQAQKSSGVSAALVNNLNALANNFQTVADGAIILAGVLAGGFLGRAGGAFLGGVIANIGKFRAAAVGATGLAAVLSRGLAAVGGGPVGLAIGAVATGIFVLNSAMEDSVERSIRVSEELKAMGLIAEDTATNIDQLGNTINGLAPEQIRIKLAEIQEHLDFLKTGSGFRPFTELFGGEAVRTINDVRNILNDLINSGGSARGNVFERAFGELDESEAKAAAGLLKITQELINGNTEVGRMKDELQEISKLKLDDPFNELIARVRQFILEIQRAQLGTVGLNANLESLSGRTNPSVQRHLITRENLRREAFLKDRTEELAKTDLEIEFQKKVDEILEAATKFGATITRADAELQANIEIASEKEKKARDKAVEDFIKDEQARQQKRALDAAEQGRVKAGVIELQNAGTDLTQSSDQLDTAASALTGAAAALTNAATTSGSTISQIVPIIERKINTSGPSLADTITSSFKPLIDLIMRVEGTSGPNGFNTTVGNGLLTGGPVDLINMTLREILALQRQMLAHPANRPTFGDPTSAVGALQVVSTTLKSLINQMGLSLDQKFTPELQIRMMEQLIRNRLSEGVSDAGIVRELREEWEGLKRVSSEQILAAVRNTQAQNENAQAVKGSGTAIVQSKEEIAAAANALADQLKQAGVAVNEATLQLANVIGVEATKAITEAAPDAKVSDILTPQQAAPLAPLGSSLTAEQLLATAASAEGLAGALDRLAAAQRKVIDDNAEVIAGEAEKAAAIGASTFATEKAARARELYNQMVQAGVNIGPAEIAFIDAQSTAYANQQVQIEKATAALEANKKAAEQAAQAQAQFAEQLSGAFSGAVKGFISDLLNGKSATDALRDALIKLADQLINMAIDAIFKSLFTPTAGVGGGLLAGLFHEGGVAGAGMKGRSVHPSVFAGARRYHSGSLGIGQGEVPAILKRGEVILPNIDALRDLAGAKATRSGSSIIQNNTFIAQTGPILERSRGQMARESFNDINRAQRVM